MQREALKGGKLTSRFWLCITNTENNMGTLY